MSADPMWVYVKIVHDSLVDQLLILQAQMHSKKEIAKLFKRCSRDLFGVCYYVLKEENSSMDIVMDTFEVALKNAEFHQLDNPQAWLMRVARNLSLKQFHKAKRVQYNLDQQNISEKFMENGSEQEHIFKDALETRLIAEIATLKPEQSMCIELFYLADKSYQEISDEMGLEVKAIKSHIQNGKRNLSLRLNAQKK